MSRPYLLLLVLCTQLPAANVCVSGNTLASYQALGATGCTIGGLTVKNFNFIVVSSGGGDTPLTNTQITVNTSAFLGGFDIEFASTGFSVTGPQFVNYRIDYTWDPTGDMRTASDVLDPGNADVLTDLCINALFTGTCTLGTPATLHVFQGGGPSQLTDTVNFAPTGLLDVRNNIALTSGGSFNSIHNSVLIPEPATASLAASALLVLALKRRRARLGLD